MSPRPARPRTRLSPEARRDALVAATVEVLAARGYAATTAEAIAAQAGVSKGLLWYHFADLDALLEHTARRTLMVLARTVGAQLDLAAPAPQVVRAAVHAAADLLRTHAAARAAVGEIVSNLRDADGAPRLGPADYEELYQAQEAIFRRGQAEGDLDDALDARVLAVTYQGAVDAMLGYLESHPEADADRHADAVADVLLHGMCSEDARR